MKNCTAYYGGGTVAMTINELGEVEFSPKDERNMPDTLAAAELQGLFDEYDESAETEAEGRPLCRWDEVVEWLRGIAEYVSAEADEAGEGRVY